MAWVDNGAGGWEWRDETGLIQPGPMPSTPPPSGQRTTQTASTSAATASGISSAFRAVGRTTQNTVGRIGTGSGGPRPGDPVPGRPGWQYQATSDGSVRPVLVNQGAEYAGQVQQGPEPTAPQTDPRKMVDPATGQPLAPTQPKPVPRDQYGNEVDPITGRPLYTSNVGGRPQTSGQLQPQTQPQQQQTGVQSGYRPYTPDFSGLDAAQQRLIQTEQDFYGQLERLRGVDPFGNQAAIRSATDRAVSQAAGTAAGARGGAAAQAGAQRQAVGVQAQTAARGAADVAAQRRQDEVQAAQLGVQTVGAIGQLRGQIVQSEQQKVDQLTTAAEQNLRGYLGGRELDQRERDSLRNYAAQMAQVDLGRYQTDQQYRQSVDDNVTRLLVADRQLQAVVQQIASERSISEKDAFMGLMGMASGVAGGLATVASDERVKTNIRRPSTKALREFVASGEGKLYEYREPEKPGRRPGENFGPMAQDLARTEIGRTVVKKGADGRTLMVDAARLAMADHSALTHLAKRLERLERRAPRSGGRRG